MSTNQPINPLTAAHLDQIKNSLEIIDRAERQALMAQQAGINVDAQIASLTDSKKKLLQIKNVYFPGQ